MRSTHHSMIFVPRQPQIFSNANWNSIRHLSKRGSLRIAVLIWQHVLYLLLVCQFSIQTGRPITWQFWIVYELYSIMGCGLMCTATIRPGATKNLLHAHAFMCNYMRRLTSCERTDWTESSNIMIDIWRTNISYVERSRRETVDTIDNGKYQSGSEQWLHDKNWKEQKTRQKNEINNEKQIAHT